MMRAGPGASANKRPHPPGALIAYLLTMERGMGLIKRGLDGELFFNGGKHNRKTVRAVAKTDHNYLRWAYREATERLSLKDFEEFQNIMKVHGISFTFPRRKK